MDDAQRTLARRLLEGSMSKRARVLLEHVIEHGQITTGELSSLYGYDHAPRAARDVRELGIPLDQTWVVDGNGRRMAAYRLGDLANRRDIGGRRLLPRALKDALLASDERCSVCGSRLPGRALQVDHRVPYEIAGEADTANPDEFMLACGSCNRSKSWSCEACDNWREHRDPEICKHCYWASPEAYDHIAMEQRRMASVSWIAEEVAEYETLAAEAAEAGVEVSDWIKRRLSDQT